MAITTIQVIQLEARRNKIVIFYRDVRKPETEKNRIETELTIFFDRITGVQKSIPCTFIMFMTSSQIIQRLFESVMVENVGLVGSSTSSNSCQKLNIRGTNQQRDLS